MSFADRVLHAEYASPSGEQYGGLVEIAMNHVQLQGKMMPAEEHKTVFDWHFDTEVCKWKPWDTMIDSSPIPASTEVRLTQGSV